MASNTKHRKPASLAIQAKHNKRLFLPMDAVDADKLALRFRMALTRATDGAAKREDARCLAESVMMAALIADLDGSDLDDADLATSEACLRRRLVSVLDTRLAP
ncbi:hypothetical protein ACMX25_12315 [Caballeronia sp. 15715]|uniref:hypothetical protein n=1 Tax=Caballeronia sp. 15715 TaxID=3391030 RepID=UPI0039E6DB13